MSVIAEFIKLDASKVQELREAAQIKKSWFGKKADNFYSFLEINANGRQQYNGYGYHYGIMLIYLAESKEIDLMQNEYNELSDFLVDKRGHSILIFTPAQGKQFEHSLSPENFTEKEFFEFNKEFSEDENPESGEEMLAAVRLLYENLKELKEKEVLLLSVG